MAIFRRLLNSWERRKRVCGMTTSIGRVRGTIVVAMLACLVVPQISLAAGPLRSGGQRGVLDRLRPSRSNSQGGNNSAQRGPGGLVKRVIGGNNAGQGQGNTSKSEVVEKYGARTGGKWTSMGQTAPAAAAAKPSPSATAPAPTDATKPSETPVAKETTPAPSDAAVADDTAAAGDADLSLEDVKFVEPATETAGPAYRLKFRNRGTRAAGKFRIGAFAERDGKLSDDAPQTVTEIAKLAAGQDGEVTLRLPLAAVRLVSNSGATRSRSISFSWLSIWTTRSSNLKRATTWPA